MLTFNFIWDIFNVLVNFGRTMYNFLLYEITIQGLTVPLWQLLGVASIGTFIIIRLIKILLD